MNRVILTGRIIVGIVVIFSTSMMPADADPVENICAINPHVQNTHCKILPEPGQHALLVFPILVKGFCHYDVSDSGDNWLFTGNHGAGCIANFLILKDSVSVQGS